MKDRSLYCQRILHVKCTAQRKPSFVFPSDNEHYVCNVCEEDQNLSIESNNQANRASQHSRCVPLKYRQNKRYTSSSAGQRYRPQKCSDGERKMWWAEYNTGVTHYCDYEEVGTDLFTAPLNYSLGHCVSQDLKMSQGIVTKFRYSIVQQHWKFSDVKETFGKSPVRERSPIRRQPVKNQANVREEFRTTMADNPQMLFNLLKDSVPIFSETSNNLSVYLRKSREFVAALHGPYQIHALSYVKSKLQGEPSVIVERNNPQTWQEFEEILKEQLFCVGPAYFISSLDKECSEGYLASVLAIVAHFKGDNAGLRRSGRIRRPPPYLCPFVVHVETKRELNAINRGIPEECLANNKKNKVQTYHSTDKRHKRRGAAKVINIFEQKCAVNEAFKFCTNAYSYQRSEKRLINSYEYVVCTIASLIETGYRINHKILLMLKYSYTTRAECIALTR
ncbi:unnamed protein product [Acanthoscelides obtectus]|uniref:Uncharacterized protein n=1 Tax=Acanthoscelides obtectus TaxID=200917 RepID=A0A9P0KTX1_ACAOB|nr:unnamed protein product [Acanthoscelides obtectus]CAK1674703.1 hypothetical protein AOBTE_LOCUS29713 [Acanthoscelides obtectus]